jgi:hypothetical protein
MPCSGRLPAPACDYVQRRARDTRGQRVTTAFPTKVSPWDAIVQNAHCSACASGHVLTSLEGPSPRIYHDPMRGTAKSLLRSPAQPPRAGCRAAPVGREGFGRDEDRGSFADTRECPPRLVQAFVARENVGDRSCATQTVTSTRSRSTWTVTTTGCGRLSGA